MKSAFTSGAVVIVLFALLGCDNKLQDSAPLTSLTQGGFVGDPDTVTFKVKGYCPAAGRSYKDLFVSNFAVEVVQGQNRLDNDLDGIPDFIEAQQTDLLNITADKYDTNGDNYSDLIMYLSGIDRLQQARLRCMDTGSSDGSGTTLNGQFIGLNNCEKELLHLDPESFDTDGDGVPDYLELRCGMDARNGSDALLDADGDGLSNYEECKRHTPVGESNRVNGIAKLEYQYSQSVWFNPSGTQCMDFTISNVSILNGGDNNLVGFYLMETDGLQQAHLYTAFVLLPKGSTGKTVSLDFAGADGRFSAK